MEIWQLRCFIALADTLSFSRAAELLYLSQSALSRRISDLEKELDIPLFVRNTRTVELTEQGRMLQAAAKDLISRWDKIVPAVKDMSLKNESIVTLTMGYDPRALADPKRRQRVMSLLFRLRRQYPGIRILLQKRDYRDLVQAITERDMDCALVLDRKLEHRVDIDSTVLQREKMLLVFRDEKRFTPEEYRDVILNRGLVVVERETQGLHHIVRILSDLHLEPAIRFCRDPEDMTMTVESGESAAILPASVVARLDNPELQCMELPTDLAELELALLWGKGQTNDFVPTFVGKFRELFSGD